MQAFRRITVLYLTLMVLLATGCAMFGTQSDKPLTPKQQATMFMNIYNQQYDDTMFMAKNPKATPAQKDMVAKKKELLTRIWPVLRLYVVTVDNGGVPTPEVTQNLNGLINELVTLAGGV